MSHGKCKLGLENFENPLGPRGAGEETQSDSPLADDILAGHSEAVRGATWPPREPSLASPLIAPQQDVISGGEPESHVRARLRHPLASLQDDLRDRPFRHE